MQLAHTPPRGVLHKRAGEDVESNEGPLLNVPRSPNSRGHGRSGSKYQRDSKAKNQDVLPLRLLIATAFIFLFSCLLTSLWYLRAANKEIVLLVKTLKDDTDTKLELQSKFTSLAQDSSQVQAMKGQYNMLLVEVQQQRQARNDAEKDKALLLQECERLRQNATKHLNAAEELRGQVEELRGKLEASTADADTVRTALAAAKAEAAEANAAAKRQIEEARVPLAEARRAAADAQHTLGEARVLAETRQAQLLQFLGANNSCPLSELADVEALLVQYHAWAGQVTDALTSLQHVSGIGSDDVQTVLAGLTTEAELLSNKAVAKSGVIATAIKTKSAKVAATADATNGKGAEEATVVVDVKHRQNAAALR